jgi:RHS repeat-associated protein
VPIGTNGLDAMRIIRQPRPDEKPQRNAKGAYLCATRFGNISKNAISGAYSWLPTYATSPQPNNQYGSIPGLPGPSEPGVTGPYYDLNSNNQSNGNVIADGSHNYTWDADANPVTIDSTGLTFDALDRMVEQNANQSYTQLVYGPTGNKLGLMNGQTINRIRVPYPGGGLAVYEPGPTFLMYWRSPDWRGSMPFGSSYNHTVTKDSAFAPFGEEYAWYPGGTDDFTGQWAATTYDVYDFPYREYPSTEGRWISPDPAGLAAVDPSDPQTWNRYAYVRNNPLGLIDPLGLCGCSGGSSALMGYGGGGVVWGSEGDCGGGGGGGYPHPPPPPIPVPGAPSLPTGPSSGNSFIYNCLSVDELAQLETNLLGVAAGALRTSPLSPRAPNADEEPIIGGAKNIYISTPTSGAGQVYIDPSVLAESSSPSGTFEKGWEHQLIVPATEEAPGPGNWVHVLFNTGTTPITNAQGQVLVNLAKVHLDIGNPTSGLGGLLRHTASDVILATILSKAQGTCAVKIF